MVFLDSQVYPVFQVYQDGLVSQDSVHLLVSQDSVHLQDFLDILLLFKAHPVSADIQDSPVFPVSADIQVHLDLVERTERQ